MQVCLFSQHYRLFWSSNVGYFVSRNKDERLVNRSYLEHFLAKKMRLGHAHVGLKHMYDRVLKAVVTCILLEHLGSKKNNIMKYWPSESRCYRPKTVSSKRFYNDNAVIWFSHFGNLQSPVVVQLKQLCKSSLLSVTCITLCATPQKTMTVFKAHLWNKQEVVKNGWRFLSFFAYLRFLRQLVIRYHGLNLLFKLFKKLR